MKQMTLKGQKQSMLGCATRMRGAWQQGVLVSFGRITHPCSRPTQLDDRLVGINSIFVGRTAEARFSDYRIIN